MQTDSLLFQKAPFQADDDEEYCKKYKKLKTLYTVKKRLTVSASPGLLEFRSLKMPNSKTQVFFRWYELPNINQQEFLSREPQWCRFLQLWPLQHPSQSPFDFTNDNGDDKHDESSLMTPMTTMMRSTPTPTTFLPCWYLPVSFVRVNHGEHSQNPVPKRVKAGDPGGNTIFWHLHC